MIFFHDYFESFGKSGAWWNYEMNTIIWQSVSMKCTQNMFMCKSKWIGMTRLKSQKVLRFVLLNIIPGILSFPGRDTNVPYTLLLLWYSFKVVMNTKHLCIIYALTRIFIKLLQIQRVCGKSSSHISARPSRVQFTFVDRIMNCLIFNWRTRSYQNTLLVPMKLQHYIAPSICSIQGFHSTAY